MIPASGKLRSRYDLVRNTRYSLARDGVEWRAVELDEGDEIPDLNEFDALWVMGGTMDVWDVDQIAADAAENMDAFVFNAEQLYRNFMRVASAR